MDERRVRTTMPGNRSQTYKNQLLNNHVMVSDNMIPNSAHQENPNLVKSDGLDRMGGIQNGH